MAKINLGGEEREIVFNLYTAKLMKKISGVNLLDPNCMLEIFTGEEGKTPSPEDYEKTAKLIYAAMAAAELPAGAGEDWKPKYSVDYVISKIDIADPVLFKTVIAAWSKRSVEELEAKVEEFKKNPKAPLVGA